MDQFVAHDDPVTVVRETRLATLVELQEAAESHGLTARWSSTEALREQVDGGDWPILLSPALSNQPYVSPPASYRCFIWFVPRGGGDHTVSLFDVLTRSLTDLPLVAHPDRLVRLILSRTPLTRIG